MPANPSHAGVKRLWRRPLLASHFDYKTHESAAEAAPALANVKPETQAPAETQGDARHPRIRPRLPAGRRKFARTRPPGGAPGRPGVAGPPGDAKSHSVKFERRRGGLAVPSGPAAHSIRSAPARTGCARWWARGTTRADPEPRPGPPAPNFRLASSKSPRMPHLLLFTPRAPPG